MVAEAGTGGQAVELTLFYQPHAVLMDVVMPEMDGISATRKILKMRPDQIVILLTSADDDVGLVGLQAGALGFLNKDLNIDALPRAVFGAVQGEAAISRSMSMRLLEQLRAPAGHVRAGHAARAQPAHLARMGGPGPRVRAQDHGRDGDRALPLA